MSSQGALWRVGARRLVTVQTATTQQAREMKPEIRTAQENPTRENSCWNMMGYTTPPMFQSADLYEAQHKPTYLRRSR